MTPNQFFKELTRLGFEIAREENLPLKSIERAPQGNVRGRCSSNGTIWLRLHCSPTMLDRAKWQENGRTLAHELAHLKHMNHGTEFWLYAGQLCEKLSNKVGFLIPKEKSVA